MVSKKIFHYSCEGRIEKSVPRDHRLSSLGKPHDAKRRSSGWIVLSYPHTHDRFLYYDTHGHHQEKTCLWGQVYVNSLHTVYRGSYMSAHVLLNLLNKLGKRKM